jgi:hypothetical protein
MWHALRVERFDAELYLRLAGERMLVGRGELNRGQWDLPLAEAARALVAIGSVAEDDAQEVLDEYHLATALRDEHAMHQRAARRHATVARATPRALEPRRAFALDHTIEQQQWTIAIRYASFSSTTTRIGVDLVDRLAAGAGARRRAGRMRFGLMGSSPAGPPQATLADDRGTTTNAHFAGSGSDSEWHGSFHADRPLAADTRWFELDGHRIELPDEQPGVEVVVEQLSHERPALAHLWHALAAPNMLHRGPDRLEPAIAALLAAGALSADDPALADMRNVQASLDSGGAPPPRQLVDPWRSLIARRGATNGVVGTMLVGAVTPLFDGFSVGIGSLDATETGFDLEVEVAPGGSTTPFDSRLESHSLTWWAADDRGNSYLGRMGSWSGGGDQDSGEIGFGPALDPKATRLDLMPTSRSARAVIRVPLPWATEAG